MRVEVDDKNKVLAIWTAYGEINDGEIPSAVLPLIEKYRKQKYIVAIYKSGTENLNDLTTELILNNYKNMVGTLN